MYICPVESSFPFGLNIIFPPLPAKIVFVPLFVNISSSFVFPFIDTFCAGTFFKPNSCQGDQSVPSKVLT